jgi:hypothetical protein
VEAREALPGGGREPCLPELARQQLDAGLLTPPGKAAEQATARLAYEEPPSSWKRAGRYLLPLLSLLAIAVTVVVAALPRRIGAFAAGAVVATGLVLQLSGLGITLVRFYASRDSVTSHAGRPRRRTWPADCVFRVVPAVSHARA